MSKLIVYMSMSLDGFIAGPGDDEPGRGLGVGGEPLHSWLTDDGAHPDQLRPTTPANAAVFDGMLSTGAVLIGRRSWELANSWNGDHHDGVPIFVVTHTEPDFPAPGHGRWVTDDLATAVAAAKAAAGDRDVMTHGATLVQALLREGLVDELAIAIAPVLLGEGRRLFDDLPGVRRLHLLESAEGVGAVHLRYRVERDA
jgi:dihydrofolate reductase